MSKAKPFTFFMNHLNVIRYVIGQLTETKSDHVHTKSVSSGIARNSGQPGRGAQWRRSLAPAVVMD